MKRIPIMLAAAALAGDVAMAGEGFQLASGDAVFTLSLPVVLPQLVIVAPGVSVVPGSDVEVFYSNGYYWSRRNQSWYRTHDHHGAWAQVDDRYVPVAIAKSPPGRYRNYKGEKHHDEGKGNGKGNGHDGDKG